MHIRLEIKSGTKIIESAPLTQSLNFSTLMHFPFSLEKWNARIAFYAIPVPFAKNIARHYEKILGGPPPQTAKSNQVVQPRKMPGRRQSLFFADSKPVQLDKESHFRIVDTEEFSTGK